MGMKALWTSAVVLLLMVCVYLWPNPQNPLRVPLVQRVRILDAYDVKSRGAFICPDALDYTLLIAFPRQVLGGGESGQVSLICDGTNVLQTSLSSTSLVSCTWLDSFGLDGYMVGASGSSRDQPLRSHLRGGLRYEVLLENVPNGSSLWLDYRYPSGWNLTRKKRTHFQRLPLTALQTLDD